MTINKEDLTPSVFESFDEFVRYYENGGYAQDELLPHEVAEDLLHVLRAIRRSDASN